MTHQGIFLKHTDDAQTAAAVSQYHVKAASKQTVLAEEQTPNNNHRAAVTNLKLKPIHRVFKVQLLLETKRNI